FTAFKPNYTGQNPHGSKSQCGILLNDWIGVIGGGTQPIELNYFNNLHTGVVGIGSLLTVKRSCFKNIYYDNFYNEPYRGTAITSVKNNSANATSLKVMPEVYNYITVDSSYRGIYTDGSVLTASYIHILNVRTGVEEMNAPLLSTNTVSNCIITASHIGIKMATNPFARFMYVTNNDITINGAATSGLSLANYGIWMSEGNPATFVRYTADNNNITLNNALHAIYAGALNTAKIKYNVVKLHGNGSGISVFANQNSNISCNTVSGRYPAVSYNNYGIYNSLNRWCYFSCNFTDSTKTGIYFGGNNLGTKFRGNEMKKHNIGLYLNNTAVIDTQAHAGNLWTAAIYNSGYGAWNENATPNSNLLLSLFIVDTALGTTYTPNIPLGVNFGEPNDQGWFQADSGNTYSCDGLFLCVDNHEERGEGSDDLKEAIAADSVISIAYIEEAKSTAKIFLYEDLKKDSATYSNNSVLMQFLNDNVNTSFGKLNNVKQLIKEAFALDSSNAMLLKEKDSLINIHVSNIQLLDSIAAADSTIDNLTARENEIDAINTLKQDIAVIYSSINTSKVNKLNEAKTWNDAVQPNELPEYNLKQVNDINIIYEKNNKDSITQYYSTLLSIAEQCPYSGGVAVYIARSLIALFNDSIVYDDENNCLQQGYYRLQNELKNNKVLNDIDLIPNPASNYADIILNKNYEGICRVKITDIYSKVVFEQSFDCNKKQFRINTIGFLNGMYNVQISVNDNTFNVSKLIIVK
ncbi:MAG: T9SS type A sorting domain-containing protein, partial [Chromatiales bacterium]|nr:T9SS type A sorting domain-containing protein [Chromatiales bacterium]